MGATLAGNLGLDSSLELPDEKNPVKFSRVSDSLMPLNSAYSTAISLTRI